LPCPRLQVVEVVPAASFSLLVKIRAYLPLCSVYQELNCGSAAAVKHKDASSATGSQWRDNEPGIPGWPLRRAGTVGGWLESLITKFLMHVASPGDYGFSYMGSEFPIPGGEIDY